MNIKMRRKGREREGNGKSFTEKRNYKRGDSLKRGWDERRNKEREDEGRRGKGLFFFHFLLTL
jgi:hypothetical protein